MCDIFSSAFFSIIVNSSLTLASVMSDIYNTTASCSPPDGGCAVVAVGGAVVGQVTVGCAVVELVTGGADVVVAENVEDGVMPVEATETERGNG